MRIRRNIIHVVLMAHLLTGCGIFHEKGGEQKQGALSANEKEDKLKSFIDEEEPFEKFEQIKKESEEIEPQTILCENENRTRDDSVYVVIGDETLMLIAFKIYGDYRLWKKLVQWNPGINQDTFRIARGTKLRYQPPEKEFRWRVLGEPYLIVVNDTLGKISKKVYQTPRRWKEIWENNRPIIHDPNIIFTGFTLYYIPDPAAKVAKSKLSLTSEN